MALSELELQPQPPNRWDYRPEPRQAAPDRTAPFHRQRRILHILRPSVSLSSGPSLHGEASSHAKGLVTAAWPSATETLEALIF